MKFDYNCKRKARNVYELKHKTSKSSKKRYIVQKSVNGKLYYSTAKSLSKAKKMAKSINIIIDKALIKMQKKAKKVL